jgi:twitching motility protein PilJ
MAFADQLKTLFKKKAPDAARDSHGSTGYGVSTYQLETVLSETQLKSGETQYGAAEAPPSRTERTVPAKAAAPSERAGMITLPLLGQKTISQHQRVLAVMLGLSLLLLGVATLVGLNQSRQAAQQLSATGQSLMQSQRLAKSMSQALVGDVKAFPDVAQSSQVLVKSVRGLMAGDGELRLDALAASEQPLLEKVVPLVDRAEKSAATVMAQQKVLTQASDALRLINRRSSDLLALAEAVSALKVLQNAPATEIAAAGRLAMLAQRIGKSSIEFLTMDGVRPEAISLLDKDLNSFQEIAVGLLNGSSALRLAAAVDAQTREHLNALTKLHEDTRTQVTTIMGNFAGLVAVRDARVTILADSEELRRNLEELQTALSSRTGFGGAVIATLIVSVWLALWSAIGLMYVQLNDSRQRQKAAEAQQAKAQEGDLTQEATVTEDITGAIADSVNYTVEELRLLVGNVQNTAARVAQTTAEVDITSTELLAASNEQLSEIRDTGRSVLDMAARINEVSTQAQESADVARQSLQAAEVGLQAVQNAIGGMNSIRDQIQETSKRIKRLGESSQEIGEITELISDITEQTNVLALNAAIQAASAGDAGRGFSVVAEEVQRLAERSADATRQIATLVKAIQTDTQDAVGAMERSTQGVVEGAKLSDNAGTALTEIDQVSRRLADLLGQISDATSREADLANEVAGNIQHIFAVTEQTGEGTKSTAAQVRELSKMAEELRQSVARFRIA